jgi:osmoprotectant transport system permease protein
MWANIGADALRHAGLAISALVLACAAGTPLGVAAALQSRYRSFILAAAAVGRTLPSIAVLTLLIPVAGVGFAPAVIALGLLALPPLIINVDLAIRSVPASALEAAAGLGMSRRQRFFRVTAPSAFPVALTGLRTATVEVIGSATLATFIGAGGLGDDIVRGLQTGDTALLVTGAAVVAVMAFGSQAAIDRLARTLSA